MKESFFDRNKELIKSTLELNDEAINTLSFEVTRRTGLPLLLKYPVLFHGILSIITNILYPLLGIKKKSHIQKDEDFIFISCPDPVFRTKTIGLIAGSLKYSVIYLPNFHVISALRYHKYFKKENIDACFPTITVSDLYNAKRRGKRLYSALKGETLEVADRIALGVILNFLIYDSIAKRILSSAKGFNGKWILEHDKFYFTPTVVNLHQANKICTMLQHGCFVEIDVDFMPLCCDKVLCCSERERNTYISYGIKPENVLAFGAPLQAIRTDEKIDTYGRKKYNLLMLLTMVNNESIVQMKAVLEFVKNHYDGVLIRMRPRSKKNDMKLLQKELEGFEISNNRYSLTEDISVCKKVISFSEDANFEVAKLNKPFIYVHSWVGQNRELRHDLPYATEDNYKEEIQKLMTQDFYSTFSKEQYKEVLGETDVNVLRQKFEDYIRS